MPEPRPQTDDVWTGSPRPQAEPATVTLDNSSAAFTPTGSAYYSTVTDDQMPEAEARRILAEALDAADRAGVPPLSLLLAAIQDRTTPATMDAGGTERPAEGAAQGEAVDHAYAWLREVVLDAVDMRLAWNTMLIEVSDEGLGQIVSAVHADWSAWRAEAVAVTAERDGLRGKVEAIRALCDEAEREEPEAVFSQGGPMWSVQTAEVRAVLDGEA